MKLKLLFLLVFINYAASAQINVNNYITSGQAKIQTGNYLGAIENFNIVIKFRPRLPEPYFFRGLAKQQLEDFRGAIEDYTKAIEIKPYYPNAYINRGLAHLELQDYEATIADYDRALELSPRNAGIYNNRGIAKMAMEDFDGAIEDYNLALEIDPNFVNGYINRSNANIAKGNIEEAIKDLNRTIIIRPHYASAYLLRGLARFELDDYAAALRDFDQTIKLDPENAYAYNNRGIVKQELEDYEGAIMDYDLALQLNPTMPNAYYNRGIAKEVLGRSGYNEDYMIAARLDPRLDMQKLRENLQQSAQQQQQQQQGTLASNSTQQNNNQQQANQQGSTTQQNPPNSVQQDDQENDQNDEESNTDSEEERERRRFRLSLADTRNIPNNSDEVDADDGMVQNRNVIIELQGIFLIKSQDEAMEDYDRQQYYSTVIENLNSYNNYSPQLIITNNETSEGTESIKNNIQYFQEKLNADETSNNYLGRGIFNLLSDNYNDALNDFGKAIELDPENSLAYFSEANCRVKMVELIESLPDFSDNLTIPLNNIANNTPNNNNEFITDYQYILDDYQNCIDKTPDFPFVYYNEAYILCKLERYDEALKKLDLAIEKQNDFAEAYFNRGLTKIYLDDIEGGALDLSKAGELGIENAYNIIKRYCN